MLIRSWVRTVAPTSGPAGCTPTEVRCGWCESVSPDPEDFHTFVGLISKTKQVFYHFCSCNFSSRRLYKTSGSAVKLWVDSAKAAEHTGDSSVHPWAKHTESLLFMLNTLLRFLPEHPGAELLVLRKYGSETCQRANKPVTLLQKPQWLQRWVQRDGDIKEWGDEM